MAARKRVKFSVDRPKTPEDFVEKAKSTLEEKGNEEKVKTFLLRLPYSLWKEAKMKAFEEDKTLHGFILEAIRRAVEE